MSKLIFSSEVLSIQLLDTISPSLAELLRLCRLRAGLSRTSETQKFVLGNPRAWLGSAYHEVLAAVSVPKLDGLDAAVSSSWDRSVGKQYERAQTHPLDRRFGPPETWPGYHLVLAMVKVRARYVHENAHRGPVSDNVAGQVLKELHEHQLLGSSGKIIGRPDAVYGDCIVDFKTGSLYEEGSIDALKPSYIRQLRLYAFLVNEASGRWPSKGVVLPMAGSSVEVQLDPKECYEEATKALAMLNEYNSLFTKASDAAELGTPSASSCRWCSYQLFCPPFWTKVNPEWSAELGMAAIEGRVSSLPQRIYGGSAISLSLDIQKGTREVVPMTVAPLKTDVHPLAAQVQQDDIVRMVGLQQRPDGSLSVNLRTVIAVSKDLPLIKCKSYENETAF